MNAQLSFAEYDFTTRPTPKTTKLDSKVIAFPGATFSPSGNRQSETKENEKRHNYRKGEEQAVYPIKSRGQINAMADWLCHNADKKYLLAFTLGINLGLRANELLELRNCDVLCPDGSVKCVQDDFTDTTDKMSIYQKKVNKRRTMYLNESCVKVLNWYFQDKSSNLYTEDYLFPSREGGHIGVDTLRKVLKDAAKACGLRQNIGTHTLRKTFGYFHFKANRDITFLQRLFGHSSALITMRYIGVAEEEEKRAYHEVSIDVIGSMFSNRD